MLYNLNTKNFYTQKYVDEWKAFCKKRGDRAKWPIGNYCCCNYAVYDAMNKWRGTRIPAIGTTQLYKLLNGLYDLPIDRRVMSMGNGEYYLVLPFPDTLLTQFHNRKEDYYSIFFALKAGHIVTITAPLWPDYMSQQYVTGTVDPLGISPLFDRFSDEFKKSLPEVLRARHYYMNDPLICNVLDDREADGNVKLVTWDQLSLFNASQKKNAKTWPEVVRSVKLYASQPNGLWPGKGLTGRRKPQAKNSTILIGAFVWK